jgi:tetratricopeptide (TPR) repeat protein
MKVFLSSTYLDLIEHRKAAHDALEQLGLHVMWMEAFGARPEDSTKVCRTEIEESELFVGIYAHRYGWISPSEEHSITEQEFDHAQKLGKPIFGFIVDEDHAWSPKHIEHDKQTKLNAFLGKVKKYPVDFFTTPDNLAQSIASSVGHYLSEHQPISNSQPPIFQSPKPTGSTLPQQSFFFGRIKELAIIADAITPESRTWGALIDGPGGIGKTSLAIEAAHRAPKELYERKIFITAKVRELKPEGEKPLTDFTRADYLSMLNELALELGEDSIPRLAPEARTDALRIALADKKVLIIFDNLETLQPEERDRLFQFLGRLPQGNKAIVTSRRRDNIDARVVRLDRLAHDEAMQLLDELALNNPRLQRASQKERDELYEITQGNPLFIHWIAGQLGREGSQCRTIAEACAFIEKAPKDNNPLEYIFGDLLETFTESETKVLAALTYFTVPAKLDWLAQMTGLPKRQAETALEDLTDRSILISNYQSPITQSTKSQYTDSPTYFLPPLAATFIRTRRPEAVAKTGDALTDHAYALAMQYGGHANFEGFKTLDAEWNLLAAALPRLLSGDNDRLQTVCGQLVQFLNFTGGWDERIWLCEQAEARALADGNKEQAGQRAYQAGYTYSLSNQPAEVLACAARAANHWQNSTPRNKAIAIRLRGKGYKLQKDYSSAIAAFREAVEIDRTISPESDDVAIGLTDLASAEHVNKDYPAAERDYRESIRIAKKVGHREQVAETTGHLATLAFDREQWAEAETLAREALPLAEKIGRQELIAGDCHRIAKALLKQNRVNDDILPLREALSLSRRAVKIYTHLRQQDNLKEAQETLAEIEAKIKESGE